MWSTEETIVISDLHVALERGRGLFQADGQLTKFLHHVRENLSNAHLLINGDAFDFLVGPEQEMEIDPAYTVAQVAEIAGNHSQVFEALGLLATSENHEVTILGGNHDPELVLPEVQSAIEKHSQPASGRVSIRWLTNGEAALMHVGELKVLIEHGDQYDSWNWVDHEALRRVVCLTSRNVAHQGVYRTSPGSRLVLNRFNRLREQFPWLQTLQPLSASIIPLSLEVILPALPREDRFELIKAVKEANSFGARSLVDGILRRAGARSEYWASEDTERQALDEWLAEYQKTEDVWGRYDATDWVKRALKRLRSYVTTRKLKGLSDRTTFFDIDSKDENYEAVSRLISKGAGLVVHGHTHAAKAYQVNDGLYMNSGTWGQLTTLPNSETADQEWADYIEKLRAGQAHSFSRLTFVHIKKQGSETSAKLCKWTDQGVQTLSDWRFAGSAWEKRNLA
jgi:UDP-2,3-diacylglucosamine pyrophosphatase LpxH